MKYKVYVGNLGLVHEGDDKDDAMISYNEYYLQSTLGYGRASHEDVTLMEDDEIIAEYFGS